MPFQVEVKQPSSDIRVPVDELCKPGLHQARIVEVREYMGTKFNTNEPQLKALLVFEVTAGKQAGKKADMIVNPSLNEKATLYPIFIAATGKTPRPGQSFDLETELVGKPVQIVVTRRPDSDFINVDSVLAVGGDEDDEDDELANA